MLLRPSSHLLLSGICSLLIGSLPSAARADILSLDWSHLSAAYQSGAANATTTQNFTVGANTVSTVFGLDGSATASNTFILSTPTVATYGSSAPNSTSYANGGNSDITQLALQIGVAIADTTNDDVVFTINFSTAVYGATFKLFDIDYSANKFTDQVRNIVGVSNGATVLPTISGTNSTYTTVGSAANNAAAGFSNSITGVTGSAQNSGNANATITFDSNTPITSISFVYGNNTNASLGTVAPASTTQQIIALSNISWSTVAGVPVPETGSLATVGLGLAGMAAVTLRRRRQG